MKKSHRDRHGQEREYQSAYLRRSYGEDGKIRNETVANLSALPEHVLDWIDAGLKGRHLVPADAAATITRSLPHGHVAAVAAQAEALGIPALLGPTGEHREDPGEKAPVPAGQPGPARVVRSVLVLGHRA